MMSKATPLRCLTVVFMSTLVLLLGASIVSADSGDWQLRLHAQWVSSQGDALFQDDLGDGPGVYLGVERRLNDRLGIEGGIGWAEFEQDDSFSAPIFGGFGFLTSIESSLSYVPVTVAVNVHLTDSDNVDVYIAPRVGYAFVDDIELTTTVDFDFPPGFPGIPLNSPQVSNLALQTDDAELYGLRLGIDWRFGGWIFSAAVDYTVLDVDISAGPQSIDGSAASLAVDPLSLGIGAAWQF